MNGHRKATTTAGLAGVVLLAWLATPALARAEDPPRHPRARTLGAEQVLAADSLLGGAVELEVEVADVDFTTPAFLNGAPQDGLADVHFEVQLRYAAPLMLGGRNAGEFVPYQKVLVRIANTSTTSADNAVDIELAPHVGFAEGWHYASNVLLPPFDDGVDPFNDTYHVTVSVELGVPVMLHADSNPASSLFQSGQPLVVFDGDVVFGGITTLPVGDVGAQLERVQAYDDIRAAMDAGDTAQAQAVFEETLLEPFESRMDPAGYDAARGLGSEELADLLANVTGALAEQPVGPDCFVEGEVVAAECKQWIDKGIGRFFYLAILHEMDEAALDLAAGDLDAADGAAHKWDEAWAYFQALALLADKREANCEARRFGQAIQCRMGETIAQALVEGSQALLANGGVGFAAAKATVEGKLVQILYLAVVHEIIGMREKILAGDEPGYNVARVEGRAFYRTIAHLVTAQDDAALDAALEDREADLAQEEAADLVRRLGDSLSFVLDPAELVGSEVVP